MTLFQKCIEVILKAEGGYQDDSDDIGNYDSYGNLIGTNFGISARLFPDEDIKNLTKDRAIELYKKHYWDPMRLEGINDANLVLHLFDHGVNAGKKTAIRMIQGIVEAKKDGIIGYETRGKINSFGTYYKVIEGYGLLIHLIDHYKYARYKYYTDLSIRRPVTKKYLKGWYNRINNCHF